jgi:hypothetical protein
MSTSMPCTGSARNPLRSWQVVQERRSRISLETFLHCLNDKPRQIEAEIAGSRPDPSGVFCCLLRQLITLVAVTEQTR